MNPGDRERILSGLQGKVEFLTGSGGDPRKVLGEVCSLLQGAGLDYDWVGYYLVSSDEEDVLVLGPYAGAPTDHVRIPFGEGICGQAAATGKTFVVGDVSAEDNYLSCSVHVRSEVVIPLYCCGRLVGELDIDSHLQDCFDDMDVNFLHTVADLTTEIASRTGGPCC